MKLRTRLPGEQHLRRRPGSADWHFSFTVGGKRLRGSTGTADKVQAAAFAARRHAEEYRARVLGEAVTLAPAQMTWGEATDRYLFEVAKHTANGQRHQRHVLAVLRHAIGEGVPLSDFTDGLVAALVERLRAPRPRIGGRPEVLSPATINRYVAMAAVVCRRAKDVWGVQVGAWDAALHRLREPAGREVFLDHDQARRLMDEACGHLRPILLLELVTGLRMRNCLGLQWENVSLDLGRALLIQKGGRRLRVELPAPAVAMLEQLAPPDGSRRQGAVFRFGNPQVPCRCPHCAGTQYRDEPIRDIRRSFGSAARRAGVLWNGQSRLRFHDLRHTFASWLLAQTGNLQMVREALGHSQISTTQRYAHLLPGARASAVAAVADALELRISPERAKA